MTTEAEQTIDQALTTVTWFYSPEAWLAAKKAGNTQDFQPVREQIQILLGSTHPGLDDRILAMLPGENSATRAVLCRILAERDPDRDPQYALDALAGYKDGLMSRWVRKRIFGFMAPMASAHGITRLRRLKPVEHLVRQTTRWSPGTRREAVLRLGDTADPAAVPVVIKALRNRSWKTRIQAIYAIRSLHLSGVLSAVEPVADLLAKQLPDNQLRVVEAAAGALVDLGLADRLTPQGLTNPDAVKIVTLALDGRVCHPAPMWAGHEGFGSKITSVLEGGGRHA